MNDKEEGDGAHGDKAMWSQDVGKREGELYLYIRERKSVIVAIGGVYQEVVQAKGGESTDIGCGIASRGSPLQ